jgi:hypothetical protein
MAHAIRIVTAFVEQYNGKRLHSAIGDITLQDKLEEKAENILTRREAKLAAPREARKVLRNAS